MDEAGGSGGVGAVGGVVRPVGSLDLPGLIESIPSRPDAADLVTGFVPPARFAAKDFAGYVPRHPSQEAAVARLEAEGAALRRTEPAGIASRVRRLISGPPRGTGIYLDGGFGVGKTHLLAALWNAAPHPKSYLSFDELVYFIGLVGIPAARAAFSNRLLVAIDEWELDDPGNLKLALAFLRGAIASGTRVVVTSNTLPIELGAGRFSQKDFQSEIEELATAFEVVRISGDDYRHRHFESDPGRGYFTARSDVARLAAATGERALLASFDDLMGSLASVHPIRYATLVERIAALYVVDLHPVASLPDALRWVHFVDSLYDSAVPLVASSPVPLGDLFPATFAEGPYGKKISRCLSRMEELLGERHQPA